MLNRFFKNKREQASATASRSNAPITKEKKILSTAAVIAVLMTIYACRQPDLMNTSVESDWLSGGTETIFNKGVGAFSTPFPDLQAGRAVVHSIGDGSFGDSYVSAPAPLRPGLGPIYNNVSCTSCHIGDGRGKPPAQGEQLSSLLIRLSIPGTDVNGGPVAAPGFGLQLQPRGTSGVPGEASVMISYIEQNFTFADGTAYSLQTPTYTLTNSYLPLPANVMMSPRIAPPVFGLGLLEAVPESDILALADENDLNNDGISGRPNYVYDVVQRKVVLGRFGWKANTSSLLQQTASAFNQDMGITNYVFPDESSYGQSQYNDIDKGFYEVSDSLLSSVAFYVRSVGVPARRNADDANVLNGKFIFNAAGCASCHVARSTTQTNVAFPEISNVNIIPYTDLLLHDMGPALADNRPDYLASGQEWRTPPLWGIGLTQVVNGHNNFLHDGRARSLLEAVMWHGGEAQQAKDNVSKLSASDRAALIAFLQSL